MNAHPIFQFKKMLKNLDTWMTKASAHADARKFDVTTAYAILRNAGVDVGKLDFLGPIDLKP